MSTTSPPPLAAEELERPRRRPRKPPRRADEEVSYATRARSHSEVSTTEQSVERHITRSKTKSQRKSKPSRSTGTAASSKDMTDEDHGEVSGKEETPHRTKKPRSNRVCTVQSLQRVDELLIKCANYSSTAKRRTSSWRLKEAPMVGHQSQAARSVSSRCRLEEER